MRATFDCPYIESRNRGTTAIRIILAIPHLILSSVWGYAAQIASLIQWVICVFTGKRNRGIWDFNDKYIAYSARVYSYAGLLHDVFPPFGTDQGSVPARFSEGYVEPANRLTVGLRLIWAIPAAIIAMLFSIGLYVVTIISWFAIVITGKHPRGMFDFLLKAHRYLAQFYCYIYLQTDEYPSTSAGAPAAPAAA